MIARTAAVRWRVASGEVVLLVIGVSLIVRSFSF